MDFQNLYREVETTAPISFQVHLKICKGEGRGGGGEGSNQPKGGGGREREKNIYDSFLIKVQQSFSRRSCED